MRELIRFFRFFYRLRGFTIFYLLFIMVLAALAETLGVSLFLPILESGSLDNPVGKVVASAFALLHIEYSFGKLLLLLVAVFFIRSGLLVLEASYAGKIASDLLNDIRIDGMSRLFGSDYLYCLSKETGYISNAITVEFSHLAYALSVYANVLFAIVFAAMYLVVPLMLEPLLALALVVLGIPAAFVIRKVNHKTRRYSVMTSSHSARLQAILIQALHHFKYLKATYSQDSILSKLASESRALSDLNLKTTVLQAIASDGFMPFTALVIAGLLFYQVEIAGGDITQAIFLLFLLQRTMAQILGVQANYRKFLTSVGSINVYKALTQELEQNNEDLHRSGAIPSFEHPLVFRDVSFRYPSGAEVLQDISFAIHPRSTVAFVGASGVGKSTLATLLTGILRPSGGEILLGDRRYAEINQEQLRRSIGYVTQESVIFNDTVRNNITLWSENGFDEKIRAAATGAHIRSFIEGLPQGYDSLLGDNGINISGGQRQRISIARELFKDIKLLIFDEATSSLDTDAEREIQRNIDGLRGQMTVVLIAHRLSTVRNSDTIFVLKDGRIVEQGSYDQLYHQQGEFRRMVDSQSMASSQQETQEMVLSTV